VGLNDLRIVSLALGPIQPSIQWVLWARWPGGETYLLTLGGGGSKEERAFTPAPPPQHAFNSCTQAVESPHACIVVRSAPSAWLWTSQRRGTDGQRARPLPAVQQLGYRNGCPLLGRRVALLSLRLYFCTYSAVCSIMPQLSLLGV